ARGRRRGDVRGSPHHGGRPPVRPVAPADLIADGLEDLVVRLGRTPGTDPEALALARRLSTLASGLDGYLRESTSPESADLEALAAATRDHQWDGHLEAEMLSGHVEGQFLAFLTRATGARRVLELGLFTGYSALAIAEALPADGRLVACELDEGVAAMARGLLDRSPAGERIAIEIGPAAETLARLGGGGAPFDLVFIDADKAGYVDYLEAVLGGGLLAEGGVICVDNTLMQGEPWTGEPRTVNGEAITRFNAVVAADDRLRQVVLPLRDGLTLIQRV
ncbi:MAG: class I SAM-dependent methyltransferase, partial [Solirubrobacteraceae bacterium]|nr:class I SAM-dependent methyltransferase [Solirubrobacteraceae bacterium]